MKAGEYEYGIFNFINTWVIHFYQSLVETKRIVDWYRFSPFTVRFNCFSDFLALFLSASVSL